MAWSIQNQKATANGGVVHPPPPVAFLGFCDRISEIREGHPSGWGLNLLGLSETRTLLVYPQNLRNVGIVLALFNPQVEQDLEFVFRSKEGESSFRFSFKYAVQLFDQVGLPEKVTAEVPAVGWKTFAFPLGIDLVVFRPGTYDIYLESAPDNPFIGYVNLLFASTPPLTREDVAAIQADPLALKVVRAELKCNACGDTFKTYAGLEKSPSLEAEGFSWSQELVDDLFTCNCASISFELEYMRRGLHGLLRRDLTPATSAGISAARLYETTVLESMCKNFLKLITEDSREELVQKFLEANKIFFHPFLPTKLFLKPKILNYFVADFAVLNERNELLLIEIERPQIRLLKNDLGKTSELEHAFHQVRSWLQVLDDHRAAVLATLGLEIKQVASVKGVVICGRTPPGAEEKRALRSISEGRIEFFTFDDILTGAAELVRQLAHL